MSILRQSRANSAECLTTSYYHVKEELPTLCAIDNGQLPFVDSAGFTVNAFQNLSDLVIAHANILVVFIVSF